MTKTYELILRERDNNLNDINNYKNHQNKISDDKDLVVTDLTNHSHNLEYKLSESIKRIHSLEKSIHEKQNDIHNIQVETRETKNTHSIE